MRVATASALGLTGNIYLLPPKAFFSENFDDRF